MVGRPSKYKPATIARIVKILKGGGTRTDASAGAGIDIGTLSDWERQYPDFAEKVTRAEHTARERAVAAIKLALLGQDEVIETAEIVRETRLDRNGQPYTHEHTETRKAVRHIPADWRAGVEYLKRRDKAHWSERLELAGVDPAQLLALVEMLKRHQMTAGEAFAAMMNELAQVDHAATLDADDKQDNK